jgi:hypothetical protein
MLGASRRVLIFAALATAFGAISEAQTIFDGVFEDLSRYFGAATRLVATTVAGVDSVQAASVPAQDRQRAAEELKNISRAFSQLRVMQIPLVDDLSNYSRDVRVNGFDGGNHEADWKGIVLSCSAVSSLVASVLNMVEESQWLKVTFNTGDRLATREVLMGRASLLMKLSTLPAPKTSSELDQLDRMNARYRELLEALNKLNIALTRAADRLTVH